MTAYVRELRAIGLTGWLCTLVNGLLLGEILRVVIYGHL